MTTRRWMLVVAGLAVAIAGKIEAGRMFERRREYVRLASRHAAAASRFQKVVSESDLIAARRKQVALEMESSRTAMTAALDEEEKEAEFSGLIAGMFGGSNDQPAPARASARRMDAPKEDYSFQAARARSRMSALRTEQIRLDYLLRKTEFHRKLVVYHFAMSLKFANAADRPWRPLPPDPPHPR
jgi:hypothetical protein